MKKQTRNGCFETNSSSMHSIVVTKNDVHVSEEELNSNDFNYESVVIHNGKWWLYNVPHGYGRSPFKVLYSFSDKFQYAICAYLSYLYPDSDEYATYYKMFEDIAKKYIHDFKEFQIRTKDMCEYTDANGKLYKDNEIYYDCKKDQHYYFSEDGSAINYINEDDIEWYDVPDIGSIDHESADVLKGFLNKANITLEEFLTNKKYIIVVDGDEYCTGDSLRYIGLINQDFIVEEYPRNHMKGKLYEKTTS